VIADNFKDAVLSMMESIAENIPDIHKASPVKAYLTGGAAIHFYTQMRVSDDVDVILSNNVQIPQDLVVLWLNKEGNIEQIAYDYNYTPTLGILHEDYEDRATLVKTIDGKFQIYVLHPIDLIISKLVRYAANDEADIKAMVEHGYIDKQRLTELADDAINVGVGFNPKHVRLHLEWVLEMFNNENTQ